LIEVMVSSVVLAALAIGGSASTRYAGVSIQKQQSQRSSMAVATSVMEKTFKYWHEESGAAGSNQRESAGDR